MAETRINVVDALRGQQDQLKRLIAQKIWLSEAPKATLSEIEAQVVELKRLLDQLESDIQDQQPEATESAVRRLLGHDPQRPDCVAGLRGFEPANVVLAS